MKFKTFILVSMVSFGVFTWANYSSWSKPLSIGEEGALGKKVWQKYNCVSCHTIFGNGGYVGADLTHITMKRSEDELIEFFRNPPVMSPHKKRRHQGLSDEEAKSIISYFEYTGKIPTLGWPPIPKNTEKEGSL